MKRVLFVDDEQKVLDGLQRMLYPMRNEWRMAFVTSGREALERLAQSEYDVLVTDLRMPEMSGLDLLAKVVSLYPQVVRMVLSGVADQEIAVRSATLAHQYLVKPCDAATLRATVGRAFSLRVMLDDPVLKQLISSLHSLPSVPSVYLRLMEVLQSFDVSPQDVAEVVGRDISMTAKVLQLVNSAFFGIRRQITDPIEAVIYLGPEMVRQLVLVASAFRAFQPKSAHLFSIERLQSHSLAVGGLARRVAQSLELSAVLVDFAFVGGLLHDVGKLLLACNYPDKYDETLRRASDEGIPHRIVEVRAFGTTHAEVGAYLLWLWALPDPITEVVLRHHEFPADPSGLSSPAFAVHAADALLKGGLDKDAVACLTAIGLQDKLAEWQQWSREARPGKEGYVEAHPVCGRRGQPAASHRETLSERI
ncbi:MAG: response regulator [Bryobacteraceae bacterium]|jgi:putative nucleotidyltransferase with HDIG domain